MKILIVEDEKKTAIHLKKGLEENGFIVDLALDGEDGLHLAKSETYNLLILDVMLPGRDGWSVISELHRLGIKTPILFLSACDDTQDRVKGLELGADDYLVKPFSFAELLARVRTILRRSPNKQPEKFQIADLQMDLTRHKALRAGKLLDLTPKEFLLLSLLMRREGEVLSRTLIAEQVWDMNFECDTNVVDVHIGRLRSKVDEPFERKLIHTVRGAGYVFEDRS